MIKRELADIILKMVSKMPVLAITGPRQSGKTTLAKSLFPNYYYANLEFPDVHARAYSKADVLLRLPFYGDMSAFSTIEDVPVVGRKANQSRDETLHQIGLSSEKRRIVLLGLRHQDLEGVDWSKIESIGLTLKPVQYFLKPRFSIHANQELTIGKKNILFIENNYKKC